MNLRLRACDCGRNEPTVPQTGADELDEDGSYGEECSDCDKRPREAAGRLFDFADDVRADEATQVSDRDNQCKPAGGGTPGQKARRDRPKRGLVAHDPDNSAAERDNG